MDQRAIGPTRRDWWRTPGFVASGGAHAAILVFMLVHVSTVPTSEQQPETVTVETISTSELNQITNGEKTAHEMPVPQRRVDKLAALEELKPVPPTPDAQKDTPPEPSPDKAAQDPGQADKPQPDKQLEAVLPPPRPVPPAPPAPPPAAAAPPPVPTPPARPVEKTEAAPPVPPARPVEAAKPETPKVEAAAPDKPDQDKPDLDKPDAEALAPKPPPRPKQAKADPKPKPVPRPVEKQVAKVVPPKKVEPDPVPPPKPAPKPPAKPSTLDQVASILDRMKPDKPLDRVASLLDKLKPEPQKPEPPKPEPPRPVERPRAGNEVKDAKPHEDFSPDKISAMLDHDAPQHRQSTGRSLAQVASLGLPNAHAEKLSPSMAAQLDGWLIDHYRGCWSYFGLGATQDYVPQLRIRMAQDGSLMGPPALLNPPSDPNLKSLADSAIRAVNRCNPLEIPERFRPFYDQGYKQRVVRFDPKEMS